MNAESLIKKYKEELLFCDLKIKNHVNDELYDYALKHSIRKEVIREFINDLEKI